MKIEDNPSEPQMLDVYKRQILTRSRRHPKRRTQHMKKTKYRRLAAMAASLLWCLIFTVPAYAQSSEPQPETAPAPAETEAEPETQKSTRYFRSAGGTN